MFRGKLVTSVSLVAGAALSAIVIGGPAQASTDVRSVSAPSGYVVRVDDTWDIGPSSGNETSWPCDQGLGHVPGTVPIGGGTYFTSTSVKANIQDEYPTTSSWWSSYANLSSKTGRETDYLICAKPPKGYAVVSSPWVKVQPGQRAAGLTVTCPAGKPLGGGMHAYDDTFSLAPDMSNTFPTATGWQVDANNGGTAVDHVHPWVVCGTLPGYHMVIGGQVEVAPGAQIGEAAICGTGVPLSGGVRTTSASLQVGINSSYPISGGWQVYVNNGSTQDIFFNPYVVCAS